MPRTCNYCSPVYYDPPFKVFPTGFAAGDGINACAKHLAKAVRNIGFNPCTVQEVEFTALRKKQIARKTKATKST